MSVPLARWPYLLFSFREGRKANFKVAISPALIADKQALRNPQLIFDKGLIAIRAEPPWVKAWGSLWKSIISC